MEALVNPRGIAKLVSCASDEMKLTAERLKISVGTATSLRRLWLRKLTGKCALCGRKNRGNLCQKCRSTTKGKIMDSRRPRTLLKQIPAQTIMLRYECACGGMVTMTAGELLTQFIQRGTLYKVKGLCRKCRAKAKANSRPPMPKQAKSLKVSTTEAAPIAAQRPSSVAVASVVAKSLPPPTAPKPLEPLIISSGEGFHHRPFAALKELKICHA